MNNTTILPIRDHLPPPLGFEIATAIRNTYIWVLVGVGVPGNVACLVTVLSMQVTTATFYVALLAAADSVALLVKLLFHQLGTHGKMTDGACVFFKAPTFFSCYANWVLALICFERFVSIIFPLKKKVYFTKKRVYISVAILLVAMAICFSSTPFLYSDTANRNDCQTKTSMRKFEQSFDIFLSTIYFFIPFLLIAVFITLIIVGLQRHRQARERMSMAGTCSGGGVERSISVMLLCAGLVFLLLTFPSCVYHLFLVKTFSNTHDQYVQKYLWYQVTTMLTDANHAVNFAIYFLSAAKLRKRFVELMKRCLGFP